jgi:hypothetical protein
MPESVETSEQRTEVSLELSETGVKAGTNMRWFAALDRLVGNKIALWGLPTAKKLQLEAAKTEAAVEVIRASGKVAAEFVEQNPEAAKAILEDKFDDFRRARENKEAVVLEARKALEEEPVAQPGAGQSEKSEAETPIDDDWLNFFARYAELASSEKMRLLWGRILAGEIRKPGQFSLTTLRIASELDLRTAAMFQRYVRCRFGDGYLSDNLRSSNFREMKDLEDVGLVTGMDGMGINVTLGRTGDSRAAIQVGNKMLLFDAPADYRLGVIPLTRAGREIASFLPFDEEETLSILVEKVKSVSTQRTLHEAYTENGQLRFRGVVLRAF